MLSGMRRWVGLLCGVAFFLALLQASQADIVLPSQPQSDGTPTILAEYVPAKFGPIQFDNLTNVQLWEIPRECSAQTDIAPPAAFIAVWYRSGACPFETVALRVQEKGALGFIIVNWDDPVEAPRGLFTGSRASEIRIPVLEIAQTFGQKHLLNRTGELIHLTPVGSYGESVIQAFDFLIIWGVIFQPLMFAVSVIITIWMFLKKVEERPVHITYWINFAFFLLNMLRAAIDPFWTMNYVPAVLGAFLYGNPNNLVVGNLFWFAFLFLELVAKGNMSDTVVKLAKFLIWLQITLVVIGEIICLALVGSDLHALAWRFFPLWAGSILIIPMVFYSIVLFRIYRQIMRTLNLQNAHSESNRKPLKLARRIKMLGMFQTPLLIASFTMVGLRGVVPVLFGWIWSAWIWHFFIQFSGLMFHSLGYSFWFAKLRGWRSPFEKQSSSAGSKTFIVSSTGVSANSTDTWPASRIRTDP